jgi:hypothetical protein
MRRTATFLFLLISSLSYTQVFRPKDLNTEIREVTVFLSSAQIFESGATTLTPGKTLLTIRGLPPYLDEKSIQIKGEGEFTILSVNHRVNHLKEVDRGSTIDSLQREIEKINDAVASLNAREEVLNEKQLLLNENRKFSGSTTSMTVTQLKQAIDLYESENEKIRTEKLKLDKAKDGKLKEKGRLERYMSDLNNATPQPTSEIQIRVSCEKPVNGKFRLSYVVGNAGWYPKYDIRVKNIRSPLEIIYKAEVYQNTGSDWKNVKLRFSNGDPNQSGLIPTLGTWHLSYANYTSYRDKTFGGLALSNVGVVHGRVVDSDGQPLPGVNVVAKGTTVGTVTDSNGNYSLTMPATSSTLVFSFIGYTSREVVVSDSNINLQLNEDQQNLNEVVVTGYAGASRRSLNKMKEEKRDETIIPTAVVENQTTVEIEVETPYSIQSNGEKLVVDLKNISVEAMYEYFAIPKLDKDAFLMARILDWGQYNLLEGEANLYFEDAYVGRSILDAKSLQDTLNISLGRDRSIVIGREKNEQFSRRKTIGSNTTETRGFKISIRNKKSQPVRITLFDQIPTSIVGDIVVTPLELSRGDLDQRSGKVTWEMVIDPQQQKDMVLQYEVKYPRRERVILE